MGRDIRVLAAEGIYFGEGPRWHEGRLWFSDFHAHAVKSVSEAGDLRVEVELDDQPSGLGWTPDGALLIVSMIKRRVMRWKDGALSVHADLSGVAEFHCNDMVVDGMGRAYVGNFGFDLEAAIAARGAQAVMVEAVTATLALVGVDGQVSAAAGGLLFPNGSAITPDGRTLIVAETLGGRLSAFDIGADGGLSGRRVWAETGGRPPDGISLDEAGAVWFADPAAGRCVRIAEGGEILEEIDTGGACYACMLGGEDGRSLYMLTAPPLGEDAASAPKGKVLVTRVDAGHAGLP